MPTIDKDSLLINLGISDIFSLDSKNRDKLWNKESAEWKKYYESELNNEYEESLEEEY